MENYSLALEHCKTFSTLQKNILPSLSEIRADFFYPVLFCKYNNLLFVHTAVYNASGILVP